MLKLKFVRTALIALGCIVLASCTQTGISSYGGKLGGSVSTKEMRQKKIKAARERARKAKAARKAAFFAKRKAAREARRNRRIGRTTEKKSFFKRKTTKKKAKRVAKSRKKVVRKKKLRKNRIVKRKFLKRKSKVASKKARRSAKKRVAKAVTKGRKLRVKKTRKAFVPRVAGKAGSLRINAPWKCVPKKLKRVIYQIRKRWGPVTINSTHRSKRKNRLVGGKRRSWHLRCKAIDFRVHGNTRGLRNWLKRHPSVGGYKRYRSGYFHIDTGPKRTW